VILFLVLIGVGICRFLGVNAYLGMAFFFLLLFSCATKDASGMLCAFFLSIPPLLTASLSPVQFFLFGAAVSVTIKSGRIAASCALLIAFFCYGYFQGLYDYATPQLVSSILSVLIPTLLFMLIPTPAVRFLENKIVFYREKHLSRVAINRNRAAVGEKLFEISAVFKEIQATFTALGASEAEKGAKEYIRNCAVDEACKACPQYPLCQKRNLAPYLDALVSVGCMKGKVTLIDVPRALADACNNQTALLYALNRQLGEYKNYITETENAATGRALLAGQAQGVSEILKTLALEQSEPLRIYTDKERALNVNLLRAGIVCSEVLVYGEEENLTLSLVTFGKADVKLIAQIASQALNTTMMISERLPLSDDKFCCILRKKPHFDAAFGVATARKKGEKVSGDTHSVIKIDERKFMVALSDGMGSGEYARKISESTITLLESFYRAQMPSPLILSSVNKLLTFNKEESFACVDIAIVDLDSGLADVVKIGSPLAFILSGNTVKILESSSLPLGILDSLHPDAATYELAENDVLLFISDGISDAFGAAADMYECLRSIPAHNPQLLADTLLESALRASGGIAKDDMTAIAVRLFKSAQF
ncbi:MAG: SpoIIE family protein phosphatase, partial [Clostridia bacterium]|nr:SpoIIE family protein phosphatase [Clostridia bacterium]